METGWQHAYKKTDVTGDDSSAHACDATQECCGCPLRHEHYVPRVSHLPHVSHASPLCECVFEADAVGAVEGCYIDH